MYLSAYCKRKPAKRCCEQSMAHTVYIHIFVSMHIYISLSLPICIYTYIYINRVRFAVCRPREGKALLSRLQRFRVLKEDNKRTHTCSKQSMPHIVQMHIYISHYKSISIELYLSIYPYAVRARESRCSDVCKASAY